MRRAAEDFGCRLVTTVWNDDAKIDGPALAAFWEADVILFECAGARSIPSPESFGEVPVVYIDTDPSGLPASVPCVSCDGVETAALAVRQLVARRLAAYVYVDAPVDFYWSRKRREPFVASLRKKGADVRVLKGCFWPSADLESIRCLGAELAALPRPLGVFACNDLQASAVLTAAQQAGLSVPKDLSVIGVDDDVSICEATHPPLTSIRMDFVRSGVVVVELALKRLKTRRRQNLRATYDALGLMPRASCSGVSRLGDARVMAALTSLRLNLTSPTAIREAAAAMGCSVRMAELRFKAVTGHSLRETLRRFRAEQARRIRKLRPDLSPDDLARAVGYTNRSALWKALKSH